MDNEKRINPISFHETKEKGAPTKDGKVNPIYFVNDEGKVIQDPEKRRYILLLEGVAEDQEFKFFENITGRTAVRNFIVNMIETLDIHESKVLVIIEPDNKDGNVIGNDDPLVLNMISVYSFMRHIQNQDFGDSFDIEDYNYGVPEEV